MIDIHCHIVPGVDDGPADMDEAEKMIDMMYADGINGVVATSHRNHPIDFKATLDYESSLSKLRDMALKKYPGFSIYSGAELYIKDGYLDVIDAEPYDFKIQNTDYVLVEFSADSTYETVSDAVYELSIRGLRPVLAHIDKYRDIWEDEDKVDKLRQEGAYIQITGATLVGKYGKTMRKAMRKLVKRGYIDFIASDGHSPEKRRPLLNRAYKVVARDCSRAEAERIFRENPAELLAGNTVRRRAVRKPLFGIFYGFRLAPAIAITLFLLGIVFIWFLGGV
jgi:protein-tyrosine phosphatase